MSRVILIDPVEDPRWDRFVMDHPFGWICHLSGWKQVLEKSFKHMKGYYLALVDENDHIKAGLPIFEVKSWLTGKRLVNIPFATLCDPLISSSSDMKELLEFSLKLQNKLKSSFIEIRTSQSAPMLHDDRLEQHKHYKSHYLSLNCEIEQIKKRFDRKTVRPSVNRAMKSNLKLIVADEETDLVSFYKLYISTRKNIGLPPQPYIFFKMLWDTFLPDDRLALLLAEKDKKIVAGVIIFKFKNRISAEYSAWNRQYSKICPNHFLYWNAIKMAQREGYEMFDLGRTSPSNVNLMKFKGRWGTSIVELPYFYYPEAAVSNMSQHEMSIYYRIMKRIFSSVPQASLPAIGKMCYRHLG